MKRLILGYVLILGDLIFRILPVLVTAAIAGVGADRSGKKNGRRTEVFVMLFFGMLHFMLYLLLHRLFLHHQNLTETVRKIVKVGFSYQDMDYFSGSVLICLTAAVLMGMAWRAAAVFRGGSWHPVSSGIKRRCFLFLSAAAAGAFVTGCYAVSLSGTEHLVINEICGNNLSFYLEENGKSSDYIELYNAGRLACKIDGLYLSDSRETLGKKEIPACEVPPKGYLLVPLDDGSFSLNKEGGETVYLSDGAGTVLDSVTMEASKTDYSWSRQTDGNPVWVLRSCTPGTANIGGSRWVQSPVLSRESGFYQDAFDLELYAQPGTEIYYTLDGSVPTAESFLYQEPIHVYDRSSEPNAYRSLANVVYNWLEYHPDETPVDKAFVVRAAAVIRDGERGITGISEPVTATYFIDLENYRQRAVVSLTADPEELFGTDGIYMTGAEYDAWYLGNQEGDEPGQNFTQRGKEWEIAANMEYFSDALNFSQDLGLRVHGGYIRFLPLKNFSLYARKEYGGSPVFEENLFGDVASHKLAIRGGLANAVCQELSGDRNVAVQRYIPVSVFINGEFWYHSNILEKYDQYYFSQRYGIDRDNIIVVKAGEIQEGTEEDRIYLQEIYGFLETHDVSVPSDYEAFGRIVDLQSYIDYMCINIYMDNMDFDNVKNVVMWRSRTAASNLYEDGRWRWALYDMDAMEWDDAGVWEYGSQAEKDTFRLMPRFTNGVSIGDQIIYSHLQKNPDFRRQFVLTFMDLVNTNFRYDRAETILDAYPYDPVGYQGGDDGKTRPVGYYDDFFRDRASYIVPCMAEWFGLSGTLETVTLSVNDTDAGTVTLNTAAPDLTEGSWSGSYYTDYPVTVTAIPNEGYEFVRWEQKAVSDQTVIPYEEESRVEIAVEKGGVSLHAVFKKIGQ